MISENNFLIKSDSYKISHWPQYPPGTTKIGSYLESRGGMFDKTLYWGIQYILKKHFEGVQVTAEKIAEAQQFWREHFGRDLVNSQGWWKIVNEHGGKLPLLIKAVPEGTVVPTRNVLLTVENTHPDFYWLTNYAETLLVQLWYPITVATNSFHSKLVIRKYLMETHGHADNLNFKLHDFGFRGVSSYETSAIGGASHLVNFMGTDTVSGIILAMNYYNAGMCGYSIPASEHSTITSWGRDDEAFAYENMLTQYPEGLVACVSDSYDIYNACDKLWGQLLHDKVINRSGTLVIRPDSGNPLEVIPRVLNILWDRFGGYYSQKSYKVLNDHVRIIQGDGIDYAMIKDILNLMKNQGFSAENIAFGSGGGLLQKFDRDTQQFAMKCSFAVIDGKEVNVYKQPATSHDKNSKRGRLKLVRGSSEFMTYSSADFDTTPAMFDSYIDCLMPVFENGELTIDENFNNVRQRADIYTMKYADVK